MKWSEEYATGIEQIDQDHRMLFQMCEDFRSSLDSGSGGEVYSVLLDSLSLYCRGHFEFEEQCMTQHSCPKAQANEEAHKQFTQVLSGFRQRYTAYGFNHEDARQLVETMAQWLQSHICNIDIHLKNCVNQQGSPE